MSGVANNSSDFAANSAWLRRRGLANTAAALCAFAVVVYQSWFVPFFLPFFTNQDGPLRLVLYGLYSSMLAVSIAVLVTRRSIRSKILLLAIVAALGIAATAIHPIGIVTKSYLVTLLLGGTAIVLMLASAPLAMLRLSAFVTALNAVICLLDIFFINGFSSTAGRGAGLAFNPNVAAAGLLLGAAASHRAVSKKWHASFLALVSAALFATLSRSILIVAFAAVTLPVAVRVWQRYRNGERLRTAAATGRMLTVCVTFGLLVTVGSALTSNPQFRKASDEAFAGVLSAATAIDNASEAVDTSFSRADTKPASLPAPRVFTPAKPSNTPALPVPPVSRSSSPVPDVTGSPDVKAPSHPQSSAAVVPPAKTTAPSPPSLGPSATAIQSKSPNTKPSAIDSKMEALDERLTEEGKRNSISARALFLERGLLAYREGGFFGRGLEQAQSLAPHNTFVLFAIAFGHLGWLVPIGFLALAFCFARDASDLPLGIAVAGVMLTSHDILFTPSLFIPVALGAGSMLAGRMATLEPSSRSPVSIASGMAAGSGLFIAGCIAMLLFKPLLAAQHLQTEMIYTARGAYGAPVPPSRFPGLFQFADLSSKLPADMVYMRENTTPLHRVDWSPHAQPVVQKGQYTVRQGGTLLFAASDDSDPRRNGRNYEVGAPLVISPLCYFLLAIVVAWSVLTAVSLGRPNPDTP